MKLTGAEITIRTLINHGVNEIFGYPGGSVLNLYDALYNHRVEIKHYITCHEQGAAHAADGYARVTGKTGVVIATSGPGATNLVTGIATAYLDSVPMVAITGNVSTALIGKDSFQEVDITGITMPVTKHNYFVKNIDDLESIICEAFQLAHSGRPGPVLIDIPKDVQINMCEFNGGSPLEYLPFPSIDNTRVEEAVRLIKESKRPYIYAGGGVVISGAYKELAEFAELIDAPIGLSIMGLTSVDSNSPRCLGMTGMHGTYTASKAKSECDLIIGIGVRFSDRATGDKKKYQQNRNIIHIDIDPAEIDKNITTQTNIIGDVKQILSVLCKKLEKQNHPEWNSELEVFKKTQKETRIEYKGINPQKVFEAVKRYAQEDTVIATDVGQHQMWTAQHYKFTRPRTFLTSGGLGTMGFGVGAAIGGAIGSGNKKTILFTGDGSFHMNMNEIATAVMHKTPIIAVIMNNGVLGMVRQWQKAFFEERYSHTTMNRETDYVKLAESLGAVGFRITSESSLDEVISKAFECDMPVVIDCVIHEDERVLPMIPPNGSFNDIILS